jgi:hypothetical protein
MRVHGSACGNSSRVGLSLAVTMALVLCSTSATAQVISDSATQQIQSLIAEKAARTPAQLKMDSQLVYAAKTAQGAQITSLVSSLVLPPGARPDAQGFFLLDITANVSADLLNAIRTLGGQVIVSVPQFNSIRARIPAGTLETIAGRSDVAFVRPAETPMVNRLLPKRAGLSGAQRAANVRAQLENALPALAAKRGLLARLGLGFALQDTTGVKAHKADVVQTFGFNGNGVKVGVLSDGVDPLATLKASGDLPAVTVLSGQAGSGAEGTAMLEIVFDMAPQAQLFFATGGPNQAQFAANILALRAAGCDIIIDDITFFAEGVFQDGTVAKAVNTVVAGGALYFSSAGNEGRFDAGTSGTWEGDFVKAATTPTPLGAAAVHDFGGGVNSDLITQDAQSGGGFWLKWADPLGGSNNDYDLYLLNNAGTAVVAASTNPQTGSQDPFEFIGCANASPMPCGRANDRLVIVQNAGAANRALNLASWRAHFAIGTTGSTFGHNGGANTVSMAAVNVGTAGGGAFVGGATNPVETYSSDGPRKIFFTPAGAPITPGNFLFGTNGGTTLQKVDLAAADCTPDNVPGFGNPFCGTSAAAPHAGAIAALVKSARPALTGPQILNALNTSALDIMAAGRDVDSGLGIVIALAAVQTLTTPITIQSVPSGATFTISGAGCPVGTYTTPMTFNWSLATTCIVNFLSPQTIGASTYSFANYTDGSTSNPRSITTPQTAATFTAILVAPPSISKSFGAATIPLNGGSTSLSFTIKNPNTTITLAGVAFTDTLPSGLVVATPNGLSGSCGGGTITATAGSGTISLSGASLAPLASCTFSVNVTGTTAGTKNNTSSNVTSTNGGTGNQATATLVVLAPPTIAKSFADGQVEVFFGFTALSFTVANPPVNPLPLTGVGFTDVLPSGLILLAPDDVLTGTCFGGTITAVPGTSTISLSGATIPVNGSCTFSVLVNGASIGVQDNLTSAVTSTNGGTGLPASASIPVVFTEFMWFFE